jgi:hypothetical protein
MIDQVEVDDAQIPVHERKNVLERLIMVAGAAPTGVPSFVRKLRTRADSDFMLTPQAYVSPPPGSWP